MICDIKSLLIIVTLNSTKLVSQSFFLIKVTLSDDKWSRLGIIRFYFPVGKHFDIAWYRLFYSLLIFR